MIDGLGTDHDLLWQAIGGGGTLVGRLLIEKTGDVLGLFSIEQPEWGVSEVASELGLPKSTVCELLGSLSQQGLLRRTGNSRYRLGWRLFELGQTLLDTTGFRTETLKAMQELVERWSETSHLAVLDGVEAVYLAKVQPSRAVRIPISRIGARLWAHCSGVGKVLLAHENWDEVAAQFEKRGGMPTLTPNTVANLDELAEELAKVREQGFAYENQESSIGLCCVAAPIRGLCGGVVAAMSLSVPAYRFCDRKNDYTVAIVEGARRISEAIGRRRPRHYRPCIS